MQFRSPSGCCKRSSCKGSKEEFHTDITEGAETEKEGEIEL
jgi:hypothetical protein